MVVSRSRWTESPRRAGAAHTSSSTHEGSILGDVRYRWMVLLPLAGLGDTSIRFGHDQGTTVGPSDEMSSRIIMQPTSPTRHRNSKTKRMPNECRTHVRTHEQQFRNLSSSIEGHGSGHAAKSQEKCKMICMYLATSTSICCLVCLQARTGTSRPWTY